MRDAAGRPSAAEAGPTAPASRAARDPYRKRWRKDG